MWTSFSIACRATSSGVANSGPISTSKPRSAKAEAITFWPRSWPSWPILATRMRGRRPSFSAKASTSVCTRRRCLVCHADLPLIDAGDRPDLRAMAAKDLFQRREISPTVALARAASTASASRLPLPSRGRVGQRIERGLAASPDRARLAGASSLSICARAPPRCRPSGRRSALRSLGLNLLTPMTDCCAGIDARLRPGGRFLDAQLRDARPRSPCAMPPSASTSWICAQALRRKIGGQPLDIVASRPTDR